MIACLALCWLGVGCLFFTGEARGLRGSLRARGARVCLRALGWGALAVAPFALRVSHLSLALAAALVTSMAVSSLAALLGAFTPRCYALSLPLSACVAAVSVLAH